MAGEKNQRYLRWAGVSCQGSQRSRNEDRCFIGGIEDKLTMERSNCGGSGGENWKSIAGQSQAPVLMAIADGAREYPSGDKAAEIAIRTAIEYISSSASFLQGSAAIKGHFAKALVRRAFDLCDDEIIHFQRRSPSDRCMQASLSLVLLNESEMTIAHAGHGCIYLIQKGAIRQLTTYQNRPTPVDASGASSGDEQLALRWKECGNNLLGGTDAIAPGVAHLPVDLHDCVLVCSEGLSRQLGEAQILQSAMQEKSPEAICLVLVETARRLDDHDDISVVCSCISDTFDLTQAESALTDAGKDVTNSCDSNAFGYGICF